MTLDQAMTHSYEQLELLSNAARRSRAETALRLSQAVVVGAAGSKDSWDQIQDRLIEEMQTGL